MPKGMDINKIAMAEEVTAFKCPNCGCVMNRAPRCPECGQRIMGPAEYERMVQDRIKMVRAMEFICRQINDEEVFMGWLMCGVADGDIDKDTRDSEIFEEYCEDDENFAELMDCFLRCMKNAYKSGGLYCGEIVSNIGEESEEE